MRRRVCEISPQRPETEPLPFGSAPTLSVHRRLTKRPEEQTLDLFSTLHWSRALDSNAGTQPLLAREGRDGRRCDEVVELEVGTASVVSLYPREEESIDVSAHRLQLTR